MLNNPINIQISASAVAWYGAIIATAGAFVSIYNAWRDRSKIKIKYNANNYIAGKVPAGYSLGKKYIIISVYNIGRRPIKMGNISLKLVDQNKFCLISDSLMNSYNQNRVLTEENPETMYLLGADGIDFCKVEYVLAYDGVGRKYKKYTHLFPTFWKIWFKLTHYGKK